MTGTAIGLRYWYQESFNVAHVFMTLFFSINLVICYWECCLFLKADCVEQRAEYWSRRQQQSGRRAAIGFLLDRVTISKILSANVWADVWATYSLFDKSYQDRNTYGYIVDVGNGFITTLPTIFLYATFTLGFTPARIAGIVGVMLFWQLLYATAMYWVSFFISKRHRHLSRLEICIYIWGANSPWIAGPLFGLYISTCLILENNYRVLGLSI
ncbi:MAG: hypothetical protein F4X92_01285 [Gammaproteobacteria bacterium]|nr:hypothetical protein [Gammaproteobacteria bacterium]